MPRLALVFPVVSSIVAFAISLALPAFETNAKYLIEGWMHEPSKSYRGFEVLFLGWASIICGGFSWFANIFYFSTLALMGLKRRLSIPVSVVAFLVSLLPLARPLIWKDDNGYYFYMSKLNAGYYFWLGAFFLVCVAALMQFNQRRRD